MFTPGRVWVLENSFSRTRLHRPKTQDQQLSNEKRPGCLGEIRIPIKQEVTINSYRHMFVLSQFATSPFETSGRLPRAALC